MTPKQISIALYTIVRKEISRFLRLWTQTILPSAITTTLYFIVFGSFIGRQIADIEGYSYMQFIVPGLIMMSVLTNSYANVVASFFGQKFQRAIDELIVSPTPNWVIVLGYCLGGVARGLTVGVVVTIVSLFFIPLEIQSLAIVLFVVLLTSLAFSLAGFTNSIFARKFDDVQIVPTFVLTPLTYLGGVFYSITFLPQFWQTVSKFNPILYMVNVFRYGFLGITDINIIYSFAILIILVVVLFIFNVYLLKKGVGMKE